MKSRWLMMALVISLLISPSKNVVNAEIKPFNQFVHNLLPMKTIVCLNVCNKSRTLINPVLQLVIARKGIDRCAEWTG